VHIFMNGKLASEYKLEKPSITIGRYSKSDIQIPSSRVSRYHANLHQHDGTWIIEDADSLNGLTWQGSRVSQMELNDGDRIYLDPEIVLQYIEE
jgi:pSer/pThr/pTyr-binding forkhead associated (FHA) protein